MCVFSFVKLWQELHIRRAFDKCAAFFDQFFSWSFWSSSTLPRLVVLRCVVLHFVVYLVLCCVVMSLTCYSTLLA